VGSVRIVFDVNGTALGRQDYAPFGRILLPSFGMPAEGFVGNTTDGESDQGYFHARQYQTRTGKFGKVDPMYVDLFEPQAWNRYSYALNNPIRLTDVNGLYVRCIEQVISVVILGGGPQPAVIGGYAWHNKSCIDYGESNPDSSVTTPPSGPDPSPGTGTGSTGTGTGTGTPPPGGPPGAPSPPPGAPPSPPSPKPKAGCYAVPAMPVSASLDRNIQQAAMTRAAFGGSARAWWYNQVRNAHGRGAQVMAGASWDYKQIGFEDFGNFNYGATGAAVGWSRAELAFGSLWAHVRSDPLRALVPSSLANELADQIVIQRGYSYVANGCGS